MNSFLRHMTFGRLAVWMFCCISITKSYSLIAQSSREIDSLEKVLLTIPDDTNRVTILNDLARRLRKTGQEQAMEYFTEAKELSLALDYKRGLAACSITEGMLYTATGNWDKGREHYLRALEQYTDLQDYNNIADAALKVGITYGIQSDYHLAIDFFNQSLQANKQVGNKRRISDNYNNIGHCYKYLGDYEKAVDFYEQALAISIESEDSGGIAMMYNHIAIMYDYQGNYKMALDYYFNSLRINERLGITEEIGSLCSNIGIVYYYLEDYEQALEYQQKNLDIMREVKDKRGISIAHYNIGNIYESQGNYDSALIHLISGLDLREEIGDKQGIATGYFNIGQLYSKLKDDDRAIDMHNKGLDLSKEIGYKMGIGNNSISLGRIYYNQGKKELARNYLLNAYHIGEELGFPDLIRSSAETLSKLYASYHQYDKAYSYLETFKEMDDSLSNADNVKQITQLEMQYDFDKQKQQVEFEQAQERMAHQEEIERQKIVRNSFIGGFILVALTGFLIFRSYIQKKRANILLAEQKEEIQTMNERLTESLDEKEVLLREIHHRVKNNLQIISSLLNLQTHNIDDEIVKDAVKEGQSRVKSMALIHQMLYQSDRLAKINFNEYINQLVGFLSSSYKGSGISTLIHAENINLDIDTAIPLGLIINELVTNSFKYAFKGKDNGEVRIAIVENDDSDYLLTISDNGIGLPETIDMNKSDSLGLKLVNILTRQLQGKLNVKNDNGACFEITCKETVRKEG